jgi:hypothetical protein
MSVPFTQVGAKIAVGPNNQDGTTYFDHYSHIPILLSKIDMKRREDTYFAVNEKNQRPIWEKLWRTYS